MNMYYPFAFFDEAAYQRKKARSAANMTAVSVLISTAVSFVFAFGLSAFIIPVFNSVVTEFLTKYRGESKVYALAFVQGFLRSNEFNWFLSVISTIICSFIPYAVMCKLLFNTKLADAAPMKGKILGSFPFLYFAILMMASVASGVAGSLFSFFFPDAYASSPADTVEIYGESGSPAALILCFLALCVVAPFAEEFIYRGIMFGYLRKFGFSFAAFTSSVFFGLAHATVEQVVYAFVSGLLFCLIAEKSGNLKTGILIHFTNNFIGFVRSYLLPMAANEALVSAFDTAYNLLAGVFAVIGMVILFTRKDRTEKSYTEEAAISCGISSDEETEKAEFNAPISCFVCAGSIFVIITSAANLLPRML